MSASSVTRLVTGLTSAEIMAVETVAVEAETAETVETAEIVVITATTATTAITVTVEMAATEVLEETSSLEESKLNLSK